MKFKIHVFKNDDKLVTECVKTITERSRKFLNVWSAKGSVKRKFHSGDGTFQFNNAFIFRRASWLQIFLQDKDLKDAMNVHSEAEYAALVQSLEAKPGVHVDIRTQETGSTHWKVNPVPASPGKSAPRGQLIISQTDLKNTSAFINFFQGFFGICWGSQTQVRRRYAADAKDCAAGKPRCRTYVAQDEIES